MTDSIGFDLEPMVATPVVTAMPVVINQGGKLLVSSRNVAEVFEKEHKNVLQDVRAVIAACSQDFARLNFQLGSYKDANNQERPEYLLTKDGFTMLAMGYTGVKAMQFKEAYIKLFNEMKAKLEKQATPVVPTEPVDETARLMNRAKFLLDIAGITGNQQVLALDKLHKNETGKSLLALTNTQLWAPQEKQLLTPTQLGKPLGLSAIAVNQKLCALGLQVKTEAGWEATQKGLEAGAVMLDTNRKHNSGVPVRQLKWTSAVANLLS